MTSVPENIPKLNLYNFEEPQYENCDYVLTSPRSLEACSRLDIKPVDLLHKPLAEFKEELQEYELHPSTIYFFYNEQENDRQNKLKHCWEERNQIIKNDLVGIRDFSKEGIGPSLNKMNLEAANVPVLNYKIDDILGYGNIEALAEKQRSRSACSFPNDRVTKDFINESAKELHEESMKLRKELMSRKENCFRKMKSSAYSETAVDSPPSSKSTCEPNSITPDKSPTPTDKSEGSRPRSSKPRLTPKDQKILNIMKAKREAEKAFFNRREKFHLAWDEEQRREEAAKLTMEKIRRRRLAAENVLRKQEQEYWENERKKLKEMDSMQKELAAETCLANRARLISDFQRRKDKEWSLRREKELLKKKLQERNLQDLEEEEEHLRKMIESRQKESLRNASIRKMKQIHQNARKLKKENSDRFEKCKIQKETINIQSREGFENLMASLDCQHALAKSKHEKLTRQKELEQKLKRKDLDLRIEQNRKLKTQLEEEIRNRQQTYLEEKDKEHKHLLAAAAKLADMKAKKAREDRLSREKCQTANMRRLNLCLELWKKKTQENLQGKIQKCEAMQAAKDYQLSKVRASAIESQRMRNKLRQYYDSNNFDKKLLEAELYTKMGTGVQTASKNLSSLSLG